MNKRFAMIIDSSKCMDCLACIVSCQLTNGVPPLSYRNWIKKGSPEKGTGLHFQPGNCMQCDKPTCIEACPTGATFRDVTDGIVKVNTRLCIGCGSCVPACPYGARYRHPKTRVVDKCDFCIGRLSIGKEPACVETCPTRARVFGDILDVTSKAYQLLKGKEIVRIVNRKSNTDPAIYYLGETSPLDWPVEAKPPNPIRMFRDVFNPLLKGVVGLSGLGVLVMLGKQIFSNESHPAEPHDPRSHSMPAEDIGKEEGNGSENDQAS